MLSTSTPTPEGQRGFAEVRVGYDDFGVRIWPKILGGRLDPLLGLVVLQLREDFLA